MPAPGTSDELRLRYLRYIAEGRKHLAQLGVSDTYLRVLSCLSADKRPWNISSIANATELSRLTVRNSLKPAEANGAVLKCRGGYEITEAGMDVFRAQFDEFFERVKVPLIQFHRVLAKEFPDLIGGKG